jgi:hypothetical protein
MANNRIRTVVPKRAPRVNPGILTAENQLIIPLMSLFAGHDPSLAASLRISFARHPLSATRTFLARYDYADFDHLSRLQPMDAFLEKHKPKTVSDRPGGIEHDRESRQPFGAFRERGSIDVT